MPLILNPKLIIRLECNEYNSVLTKFYGSDKRNAISYTLQQDGFYRQSAASGVVNKYLTINIDSTYCIRKEYGETSTLPAWKKVHEVLLNFGSADISGWYDGKKRLLISCILSSFASWNQ